MCWCATLHPSPPQEQLLDVLRALSSPNLDIRRKTLDITLDLLTPRNIDEVSWQLLCLAAPATAGVLSCGVCGL